MGRLALVQPRVSVADSSLLTNLVAYWKLEEASGTRIDATGRGNDLTDNNTVGQAAGKVGNAASFVAANSESLLIASNADLSMGNVNFTMVSWVYVAETLTISGIINKRPTPYDPTLEYGTYVGWPDLNYFYFHVGNNAGASDKIRADTPQIVGASAWFFVAAWSQWCGNTARMGHSQW